MKNPINIIWTKKKITGRRKILLVPARKSAEASSTSIAVFSCSYPQQIMHKKIAARTAKSPVRANIPVYPSAAMTVSFCDCKAQNPAAPINPS